MTSPVLAFAAIKPGDVPAEGELFVVPDEQRRELASAVLANGPEALPHGGGEIKTVVLPLVPTLDDMLAAEIVRACVRGEVPPAGLRLFARYAAVIREGLTAGVVPLEQSLEGIYLALRCDAGALLVEATSRRAFLGGWERLRARIWKAAAAAFDPFKTPIDDGDHEFARESAMLARDHEVFTQDVARGTRWVLHVPGWPPAAAGLLLRSPRSVLFKHWARCDPDAPLGLGTNLFLSVHTASGQWVFSTDPVQRLSLEPLAARLQEAERVAAPDRAERERWFDGAPFKHSLIASPSAGTVLGASAVEALVRGWLGVADEAPTLPPRPPTNVIGDFELLDLLGRGGMGEVYRGRQRSLGRDVAIKLLSPERASTLDAQERFEREARLAATINHPNVVTVFTAGFDAGRPFIAMELVLGGDAGQLARSNGGRLPERRGLELIRDCARGLGAFERAKLVHRDIKPSNIFITVDGAAKLADLGLARSTSGDDRLTSTGLVVGTPMFMSPEQARGRPDLDVRADIYSLGACLFALLCGQRPFEGPDLVTVLTQVLGTPAPDPRALVYDLSDRTSELILSCLAKDPDERPSTAAELLARLELALDALSPRRR